MPDSNKPAARTLEEIKRKNDESKKQLIDCYEPVFGVGSKLTSVQRLKVLKLFRGKLDAIRHRKTERKFNISGIN